MPATEHRVWKLTDPTGRETVGYVALPTIDPPQFVSYRMELYILEANFTYRKYQTSFRRLMEPEFFKTEERAQRQADSLSLVSKGVNA